MIKKMVVSMVFATIAICMTAGTGLTGTFRCTVVNDTDYLAHVTLVMAPNNSTYNVNISPHGSFGIPMDGPYCPRGLRGKLTYAIFDKDIVQICTGNKVEGTASSCPDDCKNSRWKIQLSNDVPHFVEQ